MLKSVFTKLTIVMVITGMVLNLLVFLFFGILFRHRHALIVKQSVAPFISYMINDLGSPPNPVKANQLSSAAGIHIWYSGQNNTWSTTDKDEPVPRRIVTIHTENPVIQAGYSFGSHSYIVKNGSDTFHVQFMRPPINDLRLVILISVLMVFLSLTLLCAYVATRRILKPVTLLKHGVDEISSGNLSHRITLNGKDELANLANAFNGMVDRLDTMITGRERLLTDVSHELRSPLSRIRVALELLPASSATSRIREDIHEMESMISDLLDTARIKHIAATHPFIPTDIPAMLKNLTAVMECLPPGITLDCPETPVWAEVIPDSFRIAVKNIIENALTYSPDTGPPVSVALAHDETGVSISVTDHGPGIPEAEKEVIFEPFYRMDASRSRSSGGYGLGLSLCKTIIDTHGGDIRVTDDPEGGARFTIRLNKHHG